MNHELNIANAQKFIELDIPITPEDVNKRLIELQKHHHQVKIALASHKRTLALKHNQLRHPKDKELTDFDRQSMLNGELADFTYSVELCSALDESLSSLSNLLYRLS